MSTALRILAGLVLLALAGLALFVFWPPRLTGPDEIALTDTAMAWPEAGAEDRPGMAAIAADCAACHTADDGAPFAGGRAFPTPMGTVYSSNITPDKEAGIGDYTLDQFRAALVDGVRDDGAHIYPAMPYANYRKLAERDIEALYGYVMDEVEPVDAANHDNDMAFPFNLRFGIRAWKWLALAGPGFTGPSDPVLARGAYLVEGPGHCGACHSPRSALYVQQGYTGADPDFLSGGDLNDWPVPSLRGDEGAPARWSREDLRRYLRTGRNDAAGVGGEMTKVVAHSLQYLPDSDVDAMVAYLRDLAPNGGGADRPAPAPDTGRARELWQASDDDSTRTLLTAADPDALDLGARLYLDNCSGCHFEDGRGAGGVFPELDGNAIVNADASGAIIATILNGAELPSTREAPYAIAMPGFADRLDDDEVAALATFVRSAWSNTAPAVDADTVGEQRSK